MRCIRAQLLTLVLTCLAPTAGAQVPPPAPPAPSPPPPPPSQSAVGQRVSLDLKFMEPSGATLAERRVELMLGKTETVSIPKGSRTVSAETTVTRGAKPGCHHVDVTLRDKNIDNTGRFAKTVWQSASDPCGGDAITLGPKDEVRLQVGIKAAR